MKPTIPSLAVALTCSLISTPALAQPTPAEPIPEVRITGGMRFESQGAGTPNGLSGIIFAPLATSSRGDIFFLDGAVSYAFGGELFGDDSSLDISGRIGYRFLASNTWILGVNAGVDASLYGEESYVQVGVGMEALNQRAEFRANGYIPVTTASILLNSSNNVYALTNNRLILEKSDTYLVQLGGLDLEAGLPVAWFGSGDLWLYGAYYLLSGDQLGTYSGVRGRVQANLDSRLSIGATISYDDLFRTQATGYVSYRFAAKTMPAKQNVLTYTPLFDRGPFLARRGLPVERQARIRFSERSEETLITAQDPSSGKVLDVRCVGTPSGGSVKRVNCRYTDVGDALVGAPDVVLVDSGVQNNLDGQTLSLARGTWLSNSAYAPTLRTQLGPISLAGALERGNGKPLLRNANIYLESGSTVAGLSLKDVNLGSRSTQGVKLKANDLTNSSIVVTSARGLSLVDNHFFWDGSSHGPPLPPSWGYPTRKDPEAVSLRSITNLDFSGNTLKAANVREPRFVIGVDTDARLLAEGYGIWRVQDNVFGQAGTVEWVDPSLTLRSGGSLTFTGNTIAGNTFLTIRAPSSSQLSPSTDNQKLCVKDENGNLLSTTAFCQANNLNFRASYNNPRANDNLIILRTDEDYED